MLQKIERLILKAIQLKRVPIRDFASISTSLNSQRGNDRSDKQEWMTSLLSPKNLCLEFHELNDVEKRNRIKQVWQSMIENNDTVPNKLTEEKIVFLLKSHTDFDLTKRLRYLKYNDIFIYRQNKFKLPPVEDYEGTSKSFIVNNFAYYKNLSMQTRQNKLYSSFVLDSPKIVFDLQFESTMQFDELRLNTMQQIKEVLLINQRAKESFQIFFSNYTERNFMRRLNNIDEYGREIKITDNHLIFETPKSYLDLFPREKLIYLSNDAKFEMKKFDPEKVYIIGALNEHFYDPRPYVTYERALRDKIKCLRLPVEEYVDLQDQSLDLPLHMVFKILSNLYHSNSNWSQSVYNAFNESYENLGKIGKLEYRKKRLKERQRKISEFFTNEGTWKKENFRKPKHNEKKYKFVKFLNFFK